MTFVEKHRCLERLKEWLHKGRAGSLEELANNFGVSTRTIKRWISYLREHERLKISYCRRTKKFQIVQD